jgi:hypothetical protein
MGLNLTKLQNISTLRFNRTFSEEQILENSFENLNESSQGNYGLITMLSIFTLLTIWAATSHSSRFNFLQKMVYITGVCTILSAFMLIFGFDRKWEAFSFFMSMFALFGILLYRTNVARG